MVRSGSAEGGSSPAIGHSRLLYVVTPSSGAGGPFDHLIAIGHVNWQLPPLFWQEIPRPGDILLHLIPGDPLANTQIERRVPGGDWSVLETLGPGVDEFVDTSVAPGQVYQYRGMAMPTVGPRPARGTDPSATLPSDYSEAVTVQALPDVPEAPPVPNVIALSATELRLTWTMSISNVASIHILRQTPTEAVSGTLVTVPGGASWFVDSGLEPASEYSYWLQASNAAGDSPIGEMGQGTTLSQTLPAPSEVTVDPLQHSAFEVCWEPGALGLHSVVARRPWGLTTPEYITTVVPGMSCYTDTYAYFDAFEYWVKHTDSPPANESAWARSAPTAPEGYDWGYEYIYLPLVMRSLP